MHANIADKPVAWRLAKSTGIPFPMAVGHLAMFWGKVSQLASGGDISKIDDVMLEKWAGWEDRKKIGKFAAWVRAEHAKAGVVNEYAEYQGALEDKRERDRRRKADRRERERRERESSERTSRGSPADGAGMSHGQGADVRAYETVRDDTTRNETRQTEEGVGAPSAPDVVLESLPEEYWPDFEALMARVPNRAAWTAEIRVAVEGMHGPAVSWPQIGKAIRDYNGNGATPNLSYFRGYLRRAAAPAPPANTQGNSADTIEFEAAEIIADLKRQFVITPNGLRPDPDWMKTASAATKKALSLLGGASRILEADGKEFGFLLKDFTRFYRAAKAAQS